MFSGFSRGKRKGFLWGFFGLFCLRFLYGSPRSVFLVCVLFWRWHLSAQFSVIHTTAKAEGSRVLTRFSVFPRRAAFGRLTETRWLSNHSIWVFGSLNNVSRYIFLIWFLYIYFILNIMKVIIWSYHLARYLDCSFAKLFLL